jgi:hypothetical protein
MMADSERPLVHPPLYQDIKSAFHFPVEMRKISGDGQNDKV